ncbi:hypothetical protein HO551_04045 [Streptococcus suis]|uniref:hypothetical protein n=2 Tax=Streptococcus suis TaxID=1307 RepID=UPI000CF36DA5|nr:hypothetical protein [Streptococcus suis]MCL4882664.1 periplasmic heavy metal sensor [Streptococcus suis]MCO8179576.1 periplasmic heavy metal sensor [Streptococcus suis]MCO8213017.1 periplasmic heavy metal sensor [Streptococcus suis]NQJ50105.1 hypothetical protein [Streptococcus suis]NQJ52074.1 hypothetical protein [Streptococcus suis]
MSLETIQTTQLIGNLKIGDEIVKSYTVNIDNKGVSTIYENMYNQELYAANRKEMRKQEAEFREKRYEVEDAILAELEPKEE